MKVDRVVSDLPGERSPTVLTRQWCTINGMTEGPVETRKGRYITSDLFGFADHVAFDSKSIYFIQSTSASNRSSRVKKVLANENARRLCEMGAKVLVVTWQRKKDKLYHGVIGEFDVGDFGMTDNES